MANNTNNYAEEAANIIEKITARIKKDYENFLEELVEVGQYHFYKIQRPFIQRMMFFEEYGNYESYRKEVKKFIFDAIYPCQYSYNEQDAERMGCIDEIAKDKGYVHRYETGANSWIKEMIEFRNSILEKNPVLTGNLPWYVKEELMNTILRHHEGYQKAKKTIDKYINRIVATIITEQKDKSDHEYYKN